MKSNFNSALKCIGWHYADAVISWRKAKRESSTTVNWYHGLMFARKLTIKTMCTFLTRKDALIIGEEMRMTFARRKAISQ